MLEKDESLLELAMPVPVKGQRLFSENMKEDRPNTAFAGLKGRCPPNYCRGVPTMEKKANTPPPTPLAIEKERRKKGVKKASPTTSVLTDPKGKDKSTSPYKTRSKARHLH